MTYNIKYEKVKFVREKNMICVVKLADSGPYFRVIQMKPETGNRINCPSALVLKHFNCGLRAEVLYHKNIVKPEIEL